LDKIKADYHEHSEKILSKLVSIIGGIVEHSLAPRIANTDFDARASKETPEVDPDAPIECCLFLEAVVTNTRKMHQVLVIMLPAELLRDVFSRIFAYLDHKVPSLFKAAASSDQKFSMPLTEEGKLQLITEVEYMAKTLNGLTGVQPWNFTVTKILEQELDYSRNLDKEESEKESEDCGVETSSEKLEDVAVMPPGESEKESDRGDNDPSPEKPVDADDQVKVSETNEITSDEPEEAVHTTAEPQVDGAADVPSPDVSSENTKTASDASEATKRDVDDTLYMAEDTASEGHEEGD